MSTSSWINFSTQQIALPRAARPFGTSANLICLAGLTSSVGRNSSIQIKKCLLLSSIPLSKVSKMDFENEDVLANVASIFENDCTVSWGWSVFLYKVKVWKSTAPRAGAPGQACLPKYRAARRKVAREAEVLRQDDLAKAQCHRMLLHPPCRFRSNKFSLEHSPKNKQLAKIQVKLQLDSRVTSWPHRFFQLFTARKQPMAANIATRPFFSSDSRRRRKVFKSPSCRIPSFKRSTKPNDQAETSGHC